MLNKKNIIVAIIASILLVACSDKQDPHEQQIKALRLVGNAEGGVTTQTCKDSHYAGDASRIFSESLMNKNISENLFETARKIDSLTKDCQESGASFGVSEHPSISQIRQILGKEESTETGNVEDGMGNSPATLYKFGWLSFGVADSNVVLLKVDFKRSGY